MLPAYAGMIPTSPFLWRVISSAPRVCGDDPFLGYALAAVGLCSPRMRG